jgi:hypothetical protein
VEGIDFHLKRYLKDGHIYKEIDFEDKGQNFISLKKSFNTARLLRLMEEAGIYLLDILETIN